MMPYYLGVLLLGAGLYGWGIPTILFTDRVRMGVALCVVGMVICIAGVLVACLL